jgi:hypothetical protein
MVMRFRRGALASLIAVALSVGAGIAYTAPGEEEEEDLSIRSSQNCTFTANPDEFLAREARAKELVFEATKGLKPAGRAPLDAASITRRNFIDEEIFNALQARNVPVANLSDDYEFVRRVYLDFTGRVPSAAQVREFAANRDAQKRRALTEKLLYSPEFVDRWMMFMGEWLQITPANSLINVSTSGRNAFYNAVKERLARNQPLDRFAWDILSSGGNNWISDQGLVNFIALGRMGGGQVEDQFDMEFVRTSSMFMGMNQYDCLLCHNGRGHLELVSPWGTSSTRLQAQQMAAFFSKTQIISAENNQNIQQFLVSERHPTPYRITTPAGNRPARAAAPGAPAAGSVAPLYRTGGTPTSVRWRSSFADYMIQDRMFARNIANRLWKELYGIGLVEPVDQMDPLRLDPSKTPPGDWGLQASHPVLLEKLADELIRLNFDMRRFLLLLTDSSTYQLSSSYDGPWDVSLTTSHARHIPRRLSGEEIHDAISMATGTVEMNRLFVRGWGDTPLRYAVQVPDPTEPQNGLAGNTNGNVTGFAARFIRGNRENLPASKVGSVQMQMAMMNDNFIIQRVRNANSPRIREIVAITDDSRAIEEAFLTFVGRLPQADELTVARNLVRPVTTPVARTRAQGFEDLAWVLINKLEFMYSH